MAADPRNPAVILLTTKGSEYTAVQAIKSGAFDYIPKTLLGREQVLSAVQRAMLHRKGLLGARGSAVTGVVRLFGYDMRRCLATRDSVSVHVAFSAERGKEVVLKVLHRGRGSLSRDASFERLVTEFKLLYDIDDSCRRGDLRFPRHEPVLLHRDGVLSARAPRHAARRHAGAERGAALRARDRTRALDHPYGRRDPPRLEARQHHAARRRQRRADRLRHLAIDERAEGRAGADGRRDRRHAVLHEPRARRRRRRRRARATSTRSA